ncbi:MAG: GAF domain-containing protein [Planctomycetes bacterium]|nr:GAF domain-containing protein [Planctomycetota bacterium]
MDALLVERALRTHFPELVLDHVNSKQQYLARLKSDRYDAVLSDGSVPGCEHLEGFLCARERQANLLFFYVSSFQDPGRDLYGLKALGVNAFISKQNLPHLAPALQKALDERRRAASPDARLLAGYERLVTAVQELSLARDLPAVMAIVRRAARELTGADGATFVLREGEFCRYADEDAIGPLWKGQKFPMHSCLSGWAMTHRQPAVVEDIFSDPRIPASVYEPTFVRSVAMVPIRALDPIGAIGNYWARRRLPELHEVRLLQALADTTAVAMENVRIYVDLEKRVRERTAALESFTYAVSHDLRAPARRVHSFATMLCEDFSPQLDESARGIVDRISHCSLQMLEMIEALLELSRTSNAPLRSQQVDLAKMAREAAQACNAEAARPVDFVAPETLPVTGDAALLRIVLENLFNNAWKFSGKCARPRVELGQREGSAPTVYFVRDNGAGFNAAAAAKLFTVFQRFHNPDEYPGTGVGLATVQRIVQKHGGKIWAESEAGQGATFYFTLEKPKDEAA